MDTPQFPFDYDPLSSQPGFAPEPGEGANAKSEDPPPPIDLDLLLWLERRYPPRNPHPGDSPSDIFYRAGIAALVLELRAEYDAQRQADALVELPT